MKTLITVLFALFFVACGAGTTPPCTTNQDCADNQKCAAGVCVDQKCWSDADCISQHAVGWICDTETGQCIEKPECEKEEDCQVVQNGGLRFQFICQDYKCVDYRASDLCTGKACSGDCLSCGVTSYCYLDTCQDACLVHQTLVNIARDTACTGLTDTCLFCKCWNSFRTIPVGDGTDNCKPENKVCSVASATDHKTGIDNTDYQLMSERLKFSCENP